ncbi:MAG: DUF962 domain-containing protein [Legionellales bacterium]|nr:DUF962 domain-containing protein [Legionellales bacterium]
MIPFIEQAQGYTTVHQNLVTRYTHWAGVPLILLSLMVLLGFVHITILHVADINVAHIALLGLLIYYFRLNGWLALAITPLLIVLIWIAHFFNTDGPTAFALWSFLVLFVFGWALLFIGHVIDGKRSDFIKNLRHIWIAPLLMVAEIFFMLGRMSKLKEALYGKEPLSTPETRG